MNRVDSVTDSVTDMNSHTDLITLILANALLY